MSTSDQDGNGRLTRKQLREIRLTGSTPVISEEDAANAAPPAPVPPRAAEPVVVESAPDPVQEDADGAPLTRRQAREQERSRAAQPAVQEPAPETPSEPGVEEALIVSEVPRFDAPAADESAVDTAPVAVPAPPSAAGEIDIEEATPESDVPELEPEPDAAEADAAEADEAVTAEPPTVADEPAAEKPAERPMVGAAFGLGVKAEDSAQTFPPLFDAILDGDSAGSHHTAPSALIFTHTPGVGSLSGPVASTGELLITGTYELPEGLGSRGHALGVADGKDIDAVLIDGELAPASSPTPIAASSAVSTSKPAGEVIRPPAPEKGNKLMLTLAVVAGGLALALATVLIIAFTTNVFG